MTNIIAFPDKRPSVPEQHITSRAELQKNFWLKILPGLLEDFETPPTFMVVLSKIGTSPYMANLPEVTWAYTTPDMSCSDDSEEPSAHLALRSDVRPELVPGFGAQRRLTFLELNGEYRKEVPPAPTVPSLILEEFVSYAMSFGEVKNASKLQFGFAFLATLIDIHQLQYVGHGVRRDRFTADFWDTREHIYYVFSFDFLPLLLDDRALDYNEDQKKTQAPSTPD